MFVSIALSRRAARWAVIKDARQRQRRRRRRQLIGGVALVAAGAVSWLIAGWSSGPSPIMPNARLDGVLRLSLPGVVEDATTLGGDVWALSCRGCSGPDSMSYGDGELTEVTAAGRAVKSLAVADPTVLTSGAGAIWIAHFASGDVTRVDPHSGRTTAIIHLRLPNSFSATPPWHRFQPSGIDFSAGRVWVSTAFGYVAEIDPIRLRLIRMLWSSSAATSTTSAAGLTWVADELAGVASFAPRITRTVIHPITWRGQPVDIGTVTSGHGLIWTLGLGTDLNALNTTHMVVTTINPRTERTIGQWDVGSARTMIVANNSAIVGGGNHGRLLRLTPPNHVQTLQGPNIASLTAAAPNAIWAITPAGRLVRIGVTQP